MSALVIATAPAAEPVTTSEAKLHMRVDHSTEDTYIAALIKLARADVERITNLALINQTWDWFLDDFPVSPFKIPYYPLASITSIKWKNKIGTEATVTNTNYVVDIKSRPGRVKLISSYSWPTDELYPLNAITIRFVAGFGASGSYVPEKYRQAILLLVAHYYENREAVYASVGGNVQMLPMGVTALLADDIRWVS